MASVCSVGRKPAAACVFSVIWERCGEREAERRKSPLASFLFRSGGFFFRSCNAIGFKGAVRPKSPGLNVVACITRIFTYGRFVLPGQNVRAHLYS